MGHKLLIAANLRQGLAEVRIMYRQAAVENPLWQQWVLLALYDQGLTWELEDDFAASSQRLLKRIKRVNEHVKEVSK